MCAHTQTVLPRDWGRRIVPKKVQPLSLSLRTGVWHPCTRTYVRLLGPCFKTGETKPFRSTKSESAQQTFCPFQPCATTLATAPHPQARGEIWHSLHWFSSPPFQQVQVLFNSPFKVLCIFPSRYLCAIGLPPVFSLRWNLPPFVLQSQTKLLAPPNSKGPANGSLTLSAAQFQGTWPGP